MENILVADVMTRNANSISPNSTLLECTKKMVKKRTGSLVIVDKKNLLGFISNKDIMWVLAKKPRADLSKIKAIDISPKKIITIKSNATIQEAVSKMKKTKFYRLPVIKEGELVGIVTMKDILNFHPELYEELKELSIIKEEAEKLKKLKMIKGRRVSVRDGICEECGERDVLYRSHGMLICDSCLSSI